MVLKNQELRQMDDEFIRNILTNNPAALVDLSIKVINDLKEALEHLKKNKNSNLVN